MEDEVATICGLALEGDDAGDLGRSLGRLIAEMMSALKSEESDGS